MNYLKKTFSVAVGSKEYRDGWDAVFGGEPLSAESQVALDAGIESAKTEPLQDLGSFAQFAVEMETQDLSQQLRRTQLADFCAKLAVLPGVHNVSRNDKLDWVTVYVLDYNKYADSIYEAADPQPYPEIKVYVSDVMPT